MNEKTNTALAQCDRKQCSRFSSFFLSDSMLVIILCKRKQDLVTDDGAVISGSEFEILIMVKKDKEDLDINASMRCTTKLIVTNFKENDYNDKYAIHKAALDRNVAAVENLFENRSSGISPTDVLGRTPMDCAIEGNHDNVVNFFEKRALHCAKS